MSTFFDNIGILSAPVQISRANGLAFILTQSTPPPPPASLPGIGTFWYGPELGRLERACLRSMMEQGHEVTLFVHSEVKGIPEGIQVRDAKEITGDRPVVFTYCVKNKKRIKSPTLYSDQFRYHMISKAGLIWADLDIFLLKPLQPTNGYLFAWENDNKINNGLLALPENSPTLADLIEFCEDYYSIPPFGKKKRKIINLKIRKLIGFPVHVSRQGWGVWGPSALTWFLRKNREDHYALPGESFHPFVYKDMSPLLLPERETYDRYLRDSFAVHLWGTWLRDEIQELDDIPDGSFLSHVLDLGS